MARSGLPTTRAAATAAEYQRRWRGTLERAEIGAMREPDDAGALELLRQIRSLDERVRRGKLTPAQAWSIANGMPSTRELRARLERRAAS
jgi:hypothetical protein